MLAFIKFVYTFLFYFVYIELLLLYDLSHVNTNGCYCLYGGCKTCTHGTKQTNRITHIFNLYFAY